MPHLRSPRYGKKINGEDGGNPGQVGGGGDKNQKHQTATQVRPNDSTQWSTTPSRASGSEDIFLSLANDDRQRPSGLSEVARRRSSATPSRQNGSKLPAPTSHGPIAESRPSESPSHASGGMAPDVERTRRPLQNTSLSNPSPLRPHSPYPDPVATNIDPKQSRLDSRRSSFQQSATGPSRSRQRSIRMKDVAYSTPEVSTNRDEGQSEVRLSPSHTDGINSEASTQGTSTVWDDIDDLKERLRRLETSGGLSGNASEINERPRTGNTQTTSSNSTSFSHGENFSPTIKARSSRSPATSKLHPLLRSALAKSHNRSAPAIYQALESSANDALELAAMSRFEGEEEDDASQTRKRMIRKADNLCRSLTELCIALCDESNIRSAPTNGASGERPSTGVDPELSGNTNSPLTLMEQRRKLVDHSERLSSRLSSRTPSRLHERSDSRISSTAGSARHAPIRNSESPSWSPQALGRATTTNSALNNANIPHQTRFGFHHKSDDPDDPNHGSRSPSRALTDFTLTQRRRSPRDIRLSRDYTSRHPLPEESSLSPSIRQALSTKHSNTSIGSAATVRRDSAVRADSVSPLTIPEEDRQLGQGTLLQQPRRRTIGSPSTTGPGVRRAPPSTGTGLAERLEAKRLQRGVATAGQLAGMGTSGGSNGRRVTAVDLSATAAGARPGSRKGSYSSAGMYPVAE